MFWHIQLLFSSLEFEICYTSNVEVQKDTTLPGRCNRRLNHVTGRPARYVEFDQYYFSSDEGVRNTYYLLAMCFGSMLGFCGLVFVVGQANP
jgi:hypothetical protein